MLRLLLSLLFISQIIIAQEPPKQAKPKMYRAPSAPNSTKAYQGNLNEGVYIHDLSWAANSSVACFPATQNAKFTGKHLFFVTEIPSYSTMDITLIPNDKNANMSLYAFQTGTSSSSMVPNLNSCVTCEADHKWDYPKKGKTQNHTRSVYLNAIKNPYRIVIGVAGAEDLDEGDFVIEIKTKTKEGNDYPQLKPKIYKAPSEKGATKAYLGDLAEGVLIKDLSWAANSSVACFPATQNSKFSGKHLLYLTEIPPHSKMAITVIPDDPNANMSIYAYATGTTSEAVVPNLSSCVTCEAEHQWDYPKKGRTQDHTRTVYLNALNHPYRVVIGVAGAEGLTEGKFVIQIKTE